MLLRAITLRSKIQLPEKCVSSFSIRATPSTFSRASTSAKEDKGNEIKRITEINLSELTNPSMSLEEQSKAVGTVLVNGYPARIGTNKDNMLERLNKPEFNEFVKPTPKAPVTAQQFFDSLTEQQREEYREYKEIREKWASLRYKRMTREKTEDKLWPKLMTVFERHEDYINLRQVWTTLKKGARVDASHYNFMFRYYAKEEKTLKIERLWQRMVDRLDSPNSETLDIIVNYFSGLEGGSFKTEFYLRQAEAKNITPLTSTLAAALKSYRVDKKTEDVETLWNSINEKQYKKNVDVYNEYILHKGRQGVPSAEEIWREFQGSGLAPNVDIYNSMIKICKNAGDSERAEALFAEMQQKGVTPDVKTLTELTFVHVSKQNSQRVDEIWNLIEAGVKTRKSKYHTDPEDVPETVPSSKYFEEVIRMHDNLGNTAKADHYEDKMLYHGKYVKAYTWISFGNWLKLAEKPQGIEVTPSAYQ